MSKNESLAVIDSGYSDTDCDESRCVSFGLSWLNEFDTPLNCYANADFNPMACSDGYAPRIVDSEPTVMSEFKWGTAGTSRSISGPYQYFTCCPPDLPPDTIVNRYCSDPIPVINNETPNICEGDTRTYARKMANFGSTESFVCCSIFGNNETTAFLNDTECVPFQNKIYTPTTAKNIYGNLQPISCNNQGIYKFFKYPVEDEKDNPYNIFYYKCCKKESTKLPLIIRDSTFKKSVYPQIVVSTIALFVSLLFIVALSIPLFLHLRKKREKTTTNTSTTTSTNISTNRRTPRSLELASRTTTATANNTRTNRRQHNPPGSTFSGYVLYLVYLSIPDLIMNISFLIVFGKAAKLESFNIVYLNASVMASSTANLYINGIISYEILNLLRNSNNIARSRPPSLTKVTIQVMTVYLICIVIFLIYYYIQRAQFRAHDNGDVKKDISLTKVNVIWSMIVSFALPIMFFCYVWITIWYRGYLKRLSVTRAMKELIWYFLRIFVVYNLIWLPGMFLSILGGTSTLIFGNLMCIGYLFCGIQPIVSIGLAMMKPDVRKYVIDLLTLSYIRKAPESTSASSNT